MYMNISEFRKDLKQAFDDALHGEMVTIERGGVQYQLIADGVFPKIVSPAPSSIGKSESISPSTHRSPSLMIKTKQDAVKAVEKIAPVTYVPKTNWGA